MISVMGLLHVSELRGTWNPQNTTSSRGVDGFQKDKYSVTGDDRKQETASHIRSFLKTVLNIVLTTGV